MSEEIAGVSEENRAQTMEHKAWMQIRAVKVLFNAEGSNRIL